MSLRWILTVLVGLTLKPFAWRFDRSWRHAEHGPKAWFYRACCTFAANGMADAEGLRATRRVVAHWRQFL